MLSARNVIATYVLDGFALASLKLDSTVGQQTLELSLQRETELVCPSLRSNIRLFSPVSVVPEELSWRNTSAKMDGPEARARLRFVASAARPFRHVSIRALVVVT